MDAKFTELVEQLNGLDFKGMYGSDFLHTWDKTTDELKALYIVADALRELREETGAVAGELIPLGRFYPTCAYSTEVIHMYLARQLTFGERELDEDEFLNVFRLPLRELVDRVLRGEIPDAKTQAAAPRAWCMLQEGKLS